MEGDEREGLCAMRYLGTYSLRHVTKLGKFVAESNELQAVYTNTDTSA